MKKIILASSIAFVLLGSTIFAEEATEDSVAGLYVATFDRAPDGPGLAYWVADSNLSLEGIAESFFDQNETKEKYPEGLDETDFIEKVYENTFDRAGDEAGIDYWREGLRDGNLSKQQFILAVLNGATGDDAELLNNKKDIGLTFAESNATDTELAKELMVDVSADRGSMLGSLNKLYAHLTHANENAFENNYTLDENGTIVSKDKSMKDIEKKEKKPKKDSDDDSYDDDDNDESYDDDDNDNDDDESYDDDNNSTESSD